MSDRIHPDAVPEDRRDIDGDATTADAQGGAESDAPVDERREPVGAEPVSVDDARAADAPVDHVPAQPAERGAFVEREEGADETFVEREEAVPVGNALDPEAPGEERPFSDLPPTAEPPAGLPPTQPASYQHGAESAQTDDTTVTVGGDDRAGAPELVEPPQPERPAEPTAVATAYTADRPVEDPTAPDVPVEARVDAEPVAQKPTEPVVPTTDPGAAATTAAADTTAAPTLPDGRTADELTAPQATAVYPAAAPETARHDVPPVADPDAAHAPQRQVVYVSEPTPPKRKGNRGFGVLLALLSTLLFAVLYAALSVLIRGTAFGDVSVRFLAQPGFYIPVVVFAIAFVLLVLIVNRGGWWAYVVGSLFVGLLTYLGTVGVLLVLQGVVQMTPVEAQRFLVGYLTSPIVIVAGLVAREVSLWIGAAIAARGRRVKARNAEAREDFEREREQVRVERERNGYRPA
ncbi:hypothetical protein CLV46_2828 [Diaminobutyricimonas aerilata]|uniref:Uncharacterized protein n=1 Tax=Diaminobutyricimonas aerilata TaxID=1162967 RepID=A0A2M9CMY7_9MICO|nr:Yip1 family protein [Diaminobutyricimonas aerilata]PJJ73242.1 hypothetical protein CLV46_2828 [Diaminobutyricimonas aerilata]